jgi:hypothetical protein
LIYLMMAMFVTGPIRLVSILAQVVNA